jgi:hypothetical protein
LGIPGVADDSRHEDCPGFPIASEGSRSLQEGLRTWSLPYHSSPIAEEREGTERFLKNQSDQKSNQPVF